MDLSEKTQLANDIIGSGNSKQSAGQTGAVGGFEGEWDGTLRVEDAENGVIVSHDRRIKRAPKPGEKGDYPSHDYKTYKKVFAAGAGKEITNHILSIIHSKRYKR